MQPVTYCFAETLPLHLPLLMVTGDFALLLDVPSVQNGACPRSQTFRPIYMYSCAVFATKLSSARTRSLVSHPPSFCLLIPSTSFWGWCCDAWTWPSLTLFLSHCVPLLMLVLLAPSYSGSKCNDVALRALFQILGFYKEYTVETFTDLFQHPYMLHVYIQM